MCTAVFCMNSQDPKWYFTGPGAVNSSLIVSEGVFFMNQPQSVAEVVYSLRIFIANIIFDKSVSDWLERKIWIALGSQVCIPQVLKTYPSLANMHDNEII